GFIALCAVANAAGVKQSSTRQAVVTAAKYVGVLALAAIGLFATTTASGTAAAGTPASAGPTPALEASFFTALVAVMWAYDGWADLSSLAGEVKNPARTLPRALFA